MLEALLSASRAVAQEVQQSIAQSNPGLAEGLDLPQRQRFLELLARGFDTFVHGLARATQAQTASPPAPPTSSPGIMLGPRPAAADTDNAARQAADDEAFAAKFAKLFLDMGGIFPKLAQVLSLRPDLIKNERVLRKLRTVQEECKSQPFSEAVRLVGEECQPFREGHCELREWLQYMHAGSIAQVVPFVFVQEGSTCPEPHGVVKLTFEDARKTMEIDFRLLRSQLSLMERAGPNFRGLGSLSPQQLRMIQEVWNVIVGLEAEILQEFDLRHEAECQQRGAVVLEGLLGSSHEECAWLEAWRDRALMAIFKPSGAEVSTQVVKTWRSGGEGQASSGFLTRLTAQLWLGRDAATSLVQGEERVKVLRDALRHLQVRVPSVFEEMSGHHVLAMELAKGRSLKEVLDAAHVNDDGQLPADDEDGQKAAAWFVVLLLFVILPLWGKMLLVVGCCHADPHPGNFKVSGIPGMNESGENSRPQQQRRFFWRSSSRPSQDAPPELVLSVLDWGSCVDLDESLRKTLCKLVLALHDLRWATRHLESHPEDAHAATTRECAVRGVAECIRVLGVRLEGGNGGDEFLAALGMALFDPGVAASHPLLRDGGAPELGKCFPVGSAVGKVLRVVAILVGICRELEKRMNAEGAERTGVIDRAFVDMFLVELWRPFAEEGMAD